MPNPHKIGQRVRLLSDNQVPNFGDQYGWYPNSSLNLVGGQLDEFIVEDIIDHDGLITIKVVGDFRYLVNLRFEVI